MVGTCTARQSHGGGFDDGAGGGFDVGTGGGFDASGTPGTCTGLCAHGSRAFSRSSASRRCGLSGDSAMKRRSWSAVPVSRRMCHAASPAAASSVSARAVCTWTGNTTPAMASDAATINPRKRILAPPTRSPRGDRIAHPCRVWKGRTASGRRDRRGGSGA
jgi:hypothetical protein